MIPVDAICECGQDHTALDHDGDGCGLIGCPCTEFRWTGKTLYGDDE